MANRILISTFTSLIFGSLTLLAGCGSRPTEVAQSPESTPSEIAQPEATPSESASPDNASPSSSPAPPVEAAPSKPATPNQAAPSEPRAQQRPSSVLPQKQDCGLAETQQAMNQCAQQNYQQSDEALNAAYNSLKDSLDEVAADNLVTAEKAWLEFRDGNCDFERNQFEGGSIAPLIYASCLEQLTDERLAELQQPAMPETAYEQVDQQLNQVYQALKGTLDEPTQAQLTEIQQNWLAYRDTNCNFEVNYADVVISETQCLARMTENRVYQLQAQLDRWSL
ncbi:MAG: lysozyme inhibitor LprI family protein [Cyanobacteria bacterium P01_G01_bin.38]